MPETRWRRHDVRTDATNNGPRPRTTPTIDSASPLTAVSTIPYANPSVVWREPSASITVYTPISTAVSSAYTTSLRGVPGRMNDARPIVTTRSATQPPTPRPSPSTSTPSNAAVIAPPPRASGY